MRYGISRLIRVILEIDLRFLHFLMIPLYCDAEQAWTRGSGHFPPTSGWSQLASCLRRL